MPSQDLERDGRRLARSVLAALALLLGAVAPTPGRGFEVQPLVHELGVAGPPASTRILVTNPSDRTLPIEVAVSRLVFDDSGQQSQAPAEEDFLVFPPAALIPPGGRQMIRVQWLGDPGIQTSQSYYATLSQVPVDLPEDEASGLRFLLAFNVVLHVSPQGAEPRISVLDTRIEQHQDAAPVLVARLANRGRRYGFIGQHVISLASGPRRLVLRPDDIRERKLDVFLPPGVTRTIRIPLDDGDWAEPVRLDLRPEQAD